MTLPIRILAAAMVCAVIGFSTPCCSKVIRRSESGTKLTEFDWTIRGVIAFKTEQYCTEFEQDSLAELRLSNASISTNPAQRRVPFYKAIAVTSNCKIERLVNGQRIAANLGDLSKGVKVEAKGRSYGDTYVTVSQSGVKFHALAPTYSLLVLDNGKKENRTIMVNDSCDH